MNTRNSQNIQKKILSWHHKHKPYFPWRKTRNSYKILVSEVMLQQTQIARVLIKYPKFLKRFPSWKHLAKAPLTDVLSEWQGMGYNRRAVYLKKCAEAIVSDYNIKLPKDEKTLRKLPGIGPYSARAILCFSNEICRPFIETNIRRVIIHEIFSKHTSVHDNEVYAALEKLEPAQGKREWYLALMDYGREALKHTTNPNRKSLHYARQSIFAGSSRYIRSQVVQKLLKTKTATARQLCESLKNDIYLKNISSAEITKALQTLTKDGLITKKGSLFKIT